jgi:ubiquinone/menaquinone biosynthesis C-methylase UbiE
MENTKKQVRDFWNNASCGEELYLKGETKESYLAHAKKRYELEPEIKNFAAFDLYKEKKVLEIGVGLGAEHYQFAAAGADLYGIDLTERAVAHTEKRLALFDLKSKLKVADAEKLPYEDETFDLVYAWGVLHHSPNTAKAVSEVYRVLKKGGEAKIMIYHKYSLVGYMLWIRYAFLRFKPFTSLSEIYSNYLAVSVKEVVGSNC